MEYLQGRTASPRPNRVGRTGCRLEDWDTLYTLPSADYDALVKELDNVNSLDALFIRITEGGEDEETEENQSKSQDKITAFEQPVDERDSIQTIVTTNDRQRDEKYRQHQHWLNSAVNRCDTLLDALLGLNKELTHLSSSEQRIRQTATSLAVASERTFSLVGDAVAKQLDYFDRLSHLVRLIDPANAAGMMPLPPTSPGWSPMPGSPLDAMIDADSQNVDVDEQEATRFVCLRSDFLPTLNAMEESIVFLTAKASYREAGAYLDKFIECRAKAGQLIRQHAIDAWMSMAREVARKLEAKTPSERQSESALLPLLYVKFRASTPELRPLLEKLEQLALQDTTCEEALKACQESYLDIRQRLLGPLTDERLAIIDQPDVSLVEMALDSLTFVTTMGSEERSLYTAYERLRPRILKETDPSALEELCAIVRAHLPENLELDEDRERTLEERAILQVTQRKLDKPDATDLDSCVIM
ncbi:hypothetical protein BDF19DRAFT_420989 [Syncephalis fuscata]|nr:hypothetical protein BDF19DRAFT_420989 [Syncephalis fuscata]